ncbi:hypothetical protein OROGR_014811 [Orobanche gracilis]
MEKRVFSYSAVALIGFSIFLNSGFVLCRPKDSFNSISGGENVGSWKEEIMSSNGKSPMAADDVGSTLVLARNRTKRPDILSKFRKYRGGWDIADKHYWAVRAPAFILAIIWFILFGLGLAVHYTCGWNININVEESSWSIGCILLSVGQVEFHNETLHTLNYVVNQSEYTVQTLRNVTGYLSMSKTVSVAQIFLPSDVMNDIDRLNVDLNTASDTLEQKTGENSSKIRKIFNTVRSALITVAAVVLFISILGLVLSIFGLLHAMHIFIISGWLLVAITFILCGIFLILENTVSDTCMAMGEWVENPHAETALSNILPCVDQQTTNQTLFKSKQVINDIANMINGFVGSVANSNPPLQANPTYYNQSGPLIPPLCYPYDSQLQNRSCSAQELSMGNASLVWQNYTCTVSPKGLCTDMGRLTPNMYTQLVDAVNVSYALEHYTPPLLSFQNCDFVRDTFLNITSSYCPPLGRYLRILNAGLVLISVGVMLSLATWIFCVNRPQSDEVFAKLSSRIRERCRRDMDRANEDNITPGHGA